MLTLQGGDSLVGGLPIIHITYQQYIANPSAYQDPDVIVHISGFPTAGNLPADYVGYDSNLNMEDIGNIATKAIAKVEPSDTALYLHNVGDGFINKDGDYCITDVQIAVGGTIALGTNCHVVDGGISSGLSQSVGITFNTNFYAENVPKCYATISPSDNHGMAVVSGYFKCAISLPSGTEFAPFTLDKNSHVDAVVSAPLGTFRLEANSNVVYFTPNTAISQYAPVYFTIPFIV